MESNFSEQVHHMIMLHVFLYYRSLGYRLLWSLTSPKGILISFVNVIAELSRVRCVQQSTMGKKIGYLCIEEILVLIKSTVKTPTHWCKQEWNIAFQTPVRFGGKSHGRPHFKTEKKTTTKPSPSFRLNFNVSLANGRRFSSLIAIEGRFSKRNVCDSATEIPYW